MTIKCENLKTVLKYLLHLLEPSMVCTHQPDLLSACCSRSDKLEGLNHKGGGIEKKVGGIRNTGGIGMAGFLDWAGLRWRDRDSFFGGITFLAGLWNVSYFFTVCC